RAAHLAPPAAPTVDEPAMAAIEPPTTLHAPELPAPARPQPHANGQTNGHQSNGHHGPLPAPASRVGPIAHSDPYLAQLHLTALPITGLSAQGIEFSLTTGGSLHLPAADLPAPQATARLLTAAAWTNDPAALLTAAAPA